MPKEETRENLSDASVVVAAPEQMSSELSGEVVILNLESGKYYSLGAVGATVWKMIQEPKTVGAVKEAILNTYDVTSERCEADLQALLTSLQTAGVVEVSA